MLYNLIAMQYLVRLDTMYYFKSAVGATQYDAVYYRLTWSELVYTMLLKD